MKAHLGDTPNQQLSHIELKVSHLQVVLSVVTWSLLSVKESQPHKPTVTVTCFNVVCCSPEWMHSRKSCPTGSSWFLRGLWRCGSAGKYKRVKWLKEVDCGNYTHGLRRNTIYIHAGKCFFTLLWFVLLLILTLLRSFSLQLECFLPPTHFLTSLSASFVFCHMCFCLSFCSRSRGSVGAGHVCF